MAYDLYDLIRRKGMTVQQFADAMKLSLSTVSLYRHGKRQPSLNTFAKMCYVLGVDADYLLKFFIANGEKRR